MCLCAPLLSPAALVPSKRSLLLAFYQVTDSAVRVGIPLWNCPGEKLVLVYRRPGTVPLQSDTIHSAGSCISLHQIRIRVYKDQCKSLLIFYCSAIIVMSIDIIFFYLLPMQRTLQTFDSPVSLLLGFCLIHWASYWSVLCSKLGTCYRRKRRKNKIKEIKWGVGLTQLSHVSVSKHWV